jgi:N-acetylglucosaminyldiphosphoundecaprenol N-acetyl-beta-D-mannosaminyltransferase
MGNSNCPNSNDFKKVFIDRDLLRGIFDALNDVEVIDIEVLRNNLSEQKIELYAFEEDVDFISYNCGLWGQKIKSSLIKMIPSDQKVKEYASKIPLRQYSASLDLAAALITHADIIVSKTPDIYLGEDYIVQNLILRDLPVRIWSFRQFFEWLIRETSYSFDKTPATLNECLDRIDSWIRASSSRVICSGNVLSLLLSLKNEKHQEALTSADMITAAGQPVVWMMNQLSEKEKPQRRKNIVKRIIRQTSQGRIVQERISDLCLLEGLLARANDQQRKVFFVVGQFCEPWEELRKKLSQKMALKYPNIEVEYKYLRRRENLNDLIGRINGVSLYTRKSDLVIMAQRTPYQEQWMIDNKGKISAPMIGVGYSLLIFAELYPNAPNLIQSFGLEWLVRFWELPKTRRSYMRGIRYIVKQFFKRKIKCPTVKNEINRDALLYWQLVFSQKTLPA